LKAPALRKGASKPDAGNYSVMINTCIPARKFEDGRLLINEKPKEALKKTGSAGGISGQNRLPQLFSAGFCFICEINRIFAH